MRANLIFEKFDSVYNIVQLCLIYRGNFLIKYEKISKFIKEISRHST